MRFLTVSLFCTVAAISGLVVYLEPALQGDWKAILLIGTPILAGAVSLMFAPRQPVKETERKETEKELPEVTPGPAGEIPPEPPVSPPAEDPNMAIISYLSLLQREGRLVDFFLEDIDSYDDSQVGAAAREIHRRCRAVLRETLALEPVLPGEEGARVEIDEDFDPSKIKLVGRITARPPYVGILRHPGWRCSRIRIPVATQAARNDIIAPAEVEIP